MESVYCDGESLSACTVMGRLSACTVMGRACQPLSVYCDGLGPVSVYCDGEGLSACQCVL